ncbi:hypothetical protein B7486_54465 [cyanobacterium TDX16]|nr:hypothetical protein B7486_54465 [cyanobacterium TDX16]
MRTKQLSAGARVLAGAGVAMVGLVVLAGPATAHVYFEETEAPAGGYALLTLDVPHGCDESATTEVAVQLPEGTTSVTPEQVPGWEAEVTVEELDEPLEVQHGEPITEGPTQVTWTATGEPLPHDRLLRFSMSVGMPAGEAGDIAYFPTVQTCEEGETAWIERWDGEGEEPESPSPSVELVADGGHGDEAETEAEEAETEAEQAVAADSATQDDVDSARTIAIVGVVVGLIGIIVAIAALLKARQPTAT